MTPLRILACILCALLLTTNVAGLFAGGEGLRSSRVDETLRSLDAQFRTHRNGVDFVVAANQAYAAAIRYVQGDEWRRLARPSWRDNYLIYLLALIERGAAALLPDGSWPVQFRYYEYRHHERALRRGFGICSQNALGLSDLLTIRYGIDTRMVSLDGHVVLQARTAGRGFVLLDPSLGLSFDFNAAAAPAHLAEIERAYGAIDPHLSMLARTYDASGNRITNGSHGAKDYWPAMYRAEMLLDWAKWALPGVLALMALIRPGRRRRAG